MTTIVRDNARDNEQGEEGLAYTITSAMSLDQFAAELEAAAGLTDPPTIGTEGYPPEATDANPVELWVVDAVSEQTVLDTATAHVPDPAWAPASTQVTAEDVRTMLVSGQTLTNDQIGIALADLYARSDALNNSVVTLQQGQTPPATG